MIYVIASYAVALVLLGGLAAHSWLALKRAPKL